MSSALRLARLAAAACAVMLSQISLAAGSAAAADPVDADAALAYARKSGCLKCHDSDKDGAAFKKAAAKYRGQAGAEDKLVRSLMAPRPDPADPHEDEHKAFKASMPRDSAQIKNLVQWILAQ